jgi:hypothetical protein
MSVINTRDVPCSWISSLNLRDGGTYASLPEPERIEVPVTPASGPY